MGTRRPRQMELPVPARWGGRRVGAGRKRKLRHPGPRHGRRGAHEARHPVHVTMRAGAGIPSLRSERVFGGLRRALAASTKIGFRVVHFSVQQDHIHLIVEADSARLLRHGAWGLAVRSARAVNRSARRRGQVWMHRYHHRPLRSPREVRSGLVYVLLNFRKHLRAAAGIDPRSSGPWFTGWRSRQAASDVPSPVAAPRTWLAAAGWRRGGGPLDMNEQPLPREARECGCLRARLRINPSGQS
jgi:REP element-mobilizing transposase RayT